MTNAEPGWRKFSLITLRIWLVNGATNEGTGFEKGSFGNFLIIIIEIKLHFPSCSRDNAQIEIVLEIMLK